MLDDNFRTIVIPHNVNITLAYLNTITNIIVWGVKFLDDAAVTLFPKLHCFYDFPKIVKIFSQFLFMAAILKIPWKQFQGIFFGAMLDFGENLASWIFGTISFRLT